MNELIEKLSRFEAGGEIFPAIDILDQLVEAQPDNLEYRFRLGLHCTSVGQVERGENLCSAPVSTRVWMMPTSN